MFGVGLGRFATSVEAVVFDLPGCGAAAPGADEALALLPAVIAEHLAWLRRHGEEIDANDASIVVAEDVIAAATGAADDEFCFAHDREAATADDIAGALRHMAYSRADLVALLASCPTEVLDMALPADAAVDVDEWAPGVRTIRGISEHIAASESYYRTGLGGDDGEPSFDLARNRESLCARLRSLSAADLARTYRVRRSWQQGEEHWTVRKVLRRVIRHERFHTAEIQQRIAWMFVGVPRRT